MSWTHHRTGTALVAAASLILLAGCSDSPTEPGTPDVEPVTAEVYERGTDDRLAYVHGDHLDIDAEGVGETRIVLHLWHDDHADWSTPPLRVTVTDG